jgi:hypothetical protein
MEVTRHNFRSKLEEVEEAIVCNVSLLQENGGDTTQLPLQIGGSGGGH